MTNMDKAHHLYTFHPLHNLDRPITSYRENHHLSGEGSPAKGHASSSDPFSDLSDGGGEGRLSAEAAVASRNDSA